MNLEVLPFIDSLLSFKAWQMQAGKCRGNLKSRAWTVSSMDSTMWNQKITRHIHFFQACLWVHIQVKHFRDKTPTLRTQFLFSPAGEASIQSLGQEWQNQMLSGPQLAASNTRRCPYLCPYLWLPSRSFLHNPKTTRCLWTIDRPVRRQNQLGSGGARL